MPEREHVPTEGGQSTLAAPDIRISGPAYRRKNLGLLSRRFVHRVTEHLEDYLFSAPL